MDEVENILNDIDKRVQDNTEKSKEIDNFLVNKDQEETKLTLEYAKTLLSYDLDIKEVKESQKEIRADAKANGVSVMKVNKVIANLKKMAKEKDIDVSEMETIETILLNDVDIKTMISNLTQK